MILKREPVLFQTLILATINLLVAANVISPSAELIGAINTFLAALLGFAVRQVVTPLAKPQDGEGRRLVPERA